MADDQTKLIIEISTILRNLDKTLAGLKKVEQQLKTVANVKIPTNAFASTAAAAQRSGRAQVDQARRTAREIERINAQTARQAAQQERIRERATKALTTIQTREAKRGADAFLKSMKAQEVAAGALNARMQALGNSLRSLGQGATTLGFGLTAGLTIPLVAFGKSSLDAAVTIDSLKRGLMAIVGSAEEAATQLERLTKIAKLPGIGFEEAIQGSIRLQAVGFSAAEAEKSLVEFSNAIALSGGGREELARITVQLGQLAAKGKVLSQDLRPILEAAPAVGQALLKAFGTVNADDIAELSGSSKEFLKTLTAELERLPRAAAGARNTFENFRDEVFRASAAVGDALIPVLTKLIEFAGPLITKLAESFSRLPVALQVAAVVFGTITAAIGPLAIGVGFLVTGIGRLTVGFAQLTGQGIVPATISLKAFNIAATATIARLTGLQAATIRAGGPWVLLATAIATVATALLFLNQTEAEAAATDLKAAKARDDRIKATQSELKFLEGLTGEVTQTKQQQAELARVYASLSGEAKGRIALIDDETEKLKALIAVKKEQLQIDQFAAGATLVQLVNNVTIALEKQRKAQEELNDARRIDAAAKEAAARPRGRGEREDVFIDRVTVGLGKQRDAALAAAAALEKIGEAGTEVDTAANAILELSRSTGISTKSLLEQAKAAGADADEIEKVERAIERLAQENRDAAPAVDELTRSLNLQNKALLASGEVVDNLVKARKARLSAAVTLAKEASNSFEGAIKFMEAFLRANQQLRLDVAKEAQLAGKTFDEFVREALGEKADTKGTALRNAQEALADATAKVSQESAEQLIAIEKSKNDELLRENETRFSKELISYREFIEERSRLQQVELQGEIDRQKKIAELAAEDVARQQQRAGAVGGAERTRALAAEQASKAKQIEAEIRILDLQSRQKDVAAETANELRQFTKDRERDFRELSREIDELLGKSKAAGEAAIDERFREDLIQLNNEMKLASKQFVEASDAAARSAAAAAVDQIASQKEILDNRIKQSKAAVQLRAAQEDINRAQDRQSNLEREIAFQVEFRGLSEREAIEKRLEGERLVRAEIEKQQAALKEVILTLKRMGLEVPLGLLEGLERFKVAAKGLGESPFAEQFKLAEEDLGRVADELAEKIADVERAIRSRTISELEGRVIIRRLNGEYVGELERQLEILKQIAAQSNDESLKRQARSAEQSVKDTRAAADELENFNAQLKSVAIDSFGDSLSQLFKDLRDNTESAAQDILNFFNNILNRVNDFIAENLAQRIAESLFPDPNAPKREGGILGFFKSLFGFGTEAEPTTAANTAATDANTAAINALTAAFGGQPAIGGDAGSLLTGAIGGFAGGSGNKVVSGINDIAGAFGISIPGVTDAAATAGSTVIDALNINSQNLKKLTDAVIENTRAQGGGGEDTANMIASLFGGGGEATGNIIEAAPRGRMIRVAEAGYDEAVLTTDPKHALRQAAILREYLRRTRGLYGRFKAVPEFAEGAMISARDAEANLLASLSASRSPSLASMVPTELATRGETAPSVNFRNINLLDRREMVRGHLRSAEGAHDILNVISENADEIGRRIRVR